jgi:hypothetical protein
MLGANLIEHLVAGYTVSGLKRPRGIIETAVDYFAIPATGLLAKGGMALKNIDSTSGTGNPGGDTQTYYPGSDNNYI